MTLSRSHIKLTQNSPLGKELLKPCHLCRLDYVMLKHVSIDILDHKPLQFCKVIVGQLLRDLDQLSFVEVSKFPDL